MTREELILSRIEYRSSMPLHHTDRVLFHYMHDRLTGMTRYVVVTSRNAPILAFSMTKGRYTDLPRKFTKILLLAAFPFI